MSTKYAVCTLRRSDGALIPEHWHLDTRAEAVASRNLYETEVPECLWLITTYKYKPDMWAKQIFKAINS